MGRRRGYLVALLVVAGLADAGAQEVRYVTDSLPLEARSGPSTAHKILLMLESGTRVTVMEEADGYSRVQPPSGPEVWILSRYLQPVASARERLADATKELEGLREEKTSLSAALEQTRNAGAQAESALQTAQSANQALQQELAAIKQAAASTLATRAENARLISELDALRGQLDILSSETRTLKESRQRESFIAGAGVLGAGLLLGLILPRLRGRRRRDRNTF